MAVAHHTGPMPAALRIRFGEARVVGQFGFDVGQVGGGLMTRVGDDPDIGLAACERFAQHVRERDDGGFGTAARADEVEFEGGRRGARIEGRGTRR